MIGSTPPAERSKGQSLFDLRDNTYSQNKTIHMIVFYNLEEDFS